MRLFGRELTGYATTLVVLVAILLVSSGLCGMQLAILSASQEIEKQLTGLFTTTGLAELAAMALSALGIVVTLMAWAISSLVARFRAPRGGDGDKGGRER